MKGFSYKNRTGHTKVVLAGDQRGTAQVSRSADTFKHRREGDETLDIGVREGVFAGLHWRNTGSLQSSRQQLNVLFLIVRDVFEVLVVVLAVTWAIFSTISNLVIARLTTHQLS